MAFLWTEFKRGIKVDKVKRVVNCPVPVTACNFKCHYCYIGQTDGFSGEIRELNHSPEFIAQALSLKRMGGPCLINICGMGETLLAPYVVELTKCLLGQGHYVTLVTNGTISKRFDELCALPENLLERLFIKFSFHYLELTRLGLMDTFFANIKKIKKSTASFTVELTANDESIAHIDDIRSVCLEELGAVCHIIESRNNNDSGMGRLTQLPCEDHLKAWSACDSDLIRFQQTTWGKKRKEFCYAGDWVLNFYMETGDVTACLGGGHKITNLYDDIERPLNATAIGTNCPWPHCYSSYFVMTNGAVPSVETPCYGLMRNRVCPDGTEWLKPKIKAFFSSQFKESNPEYSEDKKAYIDALMAEEYDNTENHYSKQKIIEILENQLTKKDIRSVSVYGTEKMGGWIADLLKGTSVRVKFIVKDDFTDDSHPTVKVKIKRYVKYSLKRILRHSQDPVLLNRYDRWPKTDLAIVSLYPRFEKISGLIYNKTKSRAVSLTELVV